MCRRAYLPKIRQTQPGRGLLRSISKSILYHMLRHAYEDMRRMEALVKGSGLDWTIIHAPMLTNKPRTGAYQIAINKHLSRGASIARADLADYIVTHLADPGSYRALVEIAA
jgi:putative NADH-flavin reductase